MFPKTEKTATAEASNDSYRLLYRGGFIRESSAGRYYFLPLGLRVQQKIVQLIKSEMDATGAQEMVTPVLHPLGLWQETNRTNSAGFELMMINDRHGAEFALGGTAEEMFVDLIRKFQISYKDLPLNLYQFSAKFRDELRVRGGLLRVREFMMKDAYSFHTSEEDFKKEYAKMLQTYTQIFNKLGLKTAVVESDNGYIGGEYCHEFVVESEVGESKYLTTDDGAYAAHEDVAVFQKDLKNTTEDLKDLQFVEAKRGTTMEDGVAFHKLPLWQQIKDVLFVDEKGRYILAVVRGDYDVNEVKLAHLTGALNLRHATEDEIRTKLQSEPGFISPVGIKDNLAAGTELVIVADDSLRTIRNAYGGANKLNQDLYNVNIDRDYKPDIEGDIVLAQDGFLTTDGKKLIVKKGIEVGNIFQLGYHYSTKMKGANFIDEDGQEKPYYMGCYGIGIGRTLATIVETHHDDKGIMWPDTIAPYHVHLIALNLEEATVSEKAHALYQKLLENGVEVLFDDRQDVSAGSKFADADLIGIPNKIVISKRTGDQVEFKKRSETESTMLDFSEALKEVKAGYQQ